MATISSTTIPTDPLCWTYAGTFDNMLHRFPWTENVTSAPLLDVQLAYSVVTGRPLMLNDGYLVLNPACQRSLADQYSPLRVLLRKGYVKVLSRNAPRSLVGMVQESAKHGIRSYELLIDNPERWFATQKILDAVDADNPSFAGWPGVDLTASYRALIRHLAQFDAKERGIKGVKNKLFDDILKRFEDSLEKDPSKPRSKWEDIVMQHVEAAPARLALMQMGNEIYHHNFGIALKASPPTELAAEAEIAVLTRTSAPYADSINRLPPIRVSLTPISRK